jgi:hypothetical protein
MKFTIKEVKEKFEQDDKVKRSIHFQDRTLS